MLPLTVARAHLCLFLQRNNHWSNLIATGEVTQALADVIKDFAEAAAWNAAHCRSQSGKDGVFRLRTDALQTILTE